MKSKKLPRLGDFLRDSREEAGLTQKQVAQKLGYGTAQFISEWERGIRSPPGNALKTLVQLYDLSLHRFYDVIIEEQTRALEKDLKKDLFG
jgi:transcriptional regulator with XRE-family HTH domain